MRTRHLVWLVALLGCAGSGVAQVRPGIEVLLADSLHLVRGRRVGLLTNHTGVDRAGRRDVDLLLAAGLRVTALYSPEHGFSGAEDRPGIPDGRDSATGLPIYSLYGGGGTRAAGRAALDSLDVVLVDLQDIGARYYTYIATAVLLMRDATRAGKPVIVLDRPNPVGGAAVQGNVRPAPGDPDSVLVGLLPVPMRHGLTLGELARLADDVLGVGARLTVIPASGWRREDYLDGTGLPWVKPSPNMPDLESAQHYPGLCLFEGTNLSVGRGTAFAFQVIGAPWLDPHAVLRRLPPVAGVDVTPDSFTPHAPGDAKYDGQPVRALRLKVTDRGRYDPTRLAVALLVAVRESHPDAFRFRPESFDRLAAGPELRRAIEAGTAPDRIWGAWEEPLRRFRAARVKYLVY